MDEEEKIKRRNNCNFAIAICNVDGLFEPSEQYQKLLDKYINGEISSDDIIEELNKIYKSNKK